MDKEFVLRVNEIFHDIEAESYTAEHPEIFELEKKRWQALAEKYFKSDSPLTILDIGSGTGFVPLQISPHLKEEDTVICSDISTMMLKRCKSNLSGKFKNSFSYLKVSDERFELEPASVDIITLNSVLHHLPDTDSTFNELNRILAPGGLLIIAHEPHKDFFNHKFLWFNYKLWRLLTNPRFLLEAIMKRLGLKKLFDEKFQDKSRFTPKLEKVNSQLIAEGLITEPLSPWKMGKIVDIYSALGFSVREINQKNLTNYSVEYFKTYNHLYRVFMYSHTSAILKLYDKLLSKLFPNYGATFSVVLKK